MATIILNSAVTSVVFNGDEVDEVYFNDTYVWPDTSSDDDSSGESATAKANKLKIKASTESYNVIFTQYGISSSGEYNLVIKDSVDGYSFNGNHTEWGYYWSSDYSHLIIYHTGFCTLVFSLDDVLSGAAETTKSSGRIELDEYDDLLLPSLDGKTVADCDHIINIYYGGVFVKGVKVSDSSPMYSVPINATHRAVIRWSGTDYLMVTLYNSESGEEIEQSAASLNTAYVINGYVGGNEVTSVNVNLA